MGIFKSVARLLRAIGYLFVGNTDELTEMVMRNNPTAIKAKYDDIINAKTGDIQKFMDAVSELMLNKTQKEQLLEEMGKKLKEKEDIMKGAVAMAQKRSNDLKAKGKNDEEIQQDADYIKALNGHRDASSTATQLRERIAETAVDIEQKAGAIAQYKERLLAFQRDIAKLKDEKSDSVAKLISANQEKKLSDMLSGLSMSGADHDLDQVRRIRDKAVASAQVASDLAGVDAEAVTRQFLNYAKDSQADAEFAALVGLDSATPAEPVGELQEAGAKLPE